MELGLRIALNSVIEMKGGKVQVFLHELEKYNSILIFY